MNDALEQARTVPVPARSRLLFLRKTIWACPSCTTSFWTAVTAEIWPDVAYLQAYPELIVDQDQKRMSSNKKVPIPPK